MRQVTGQFMETFTPGSRSDSRMTQKRIKIQVWINETKLVRSIPLSDKIVDSNDVSELFTKIARICKHPNVDENV